MWSETPPCLWCKRSVTRYSLCSFQIKMTQSPMASLVLAGAQQAPRPSWERGKHGGPIHSEGFLNTFTSDEIHDGMNLELYYQ